MRSFLFRIWIFIFIYICESKFLLHSSVYWQKSICWIPPQCLSLIGKLWKLLRVPFIQKYGVFFNFDFFDNFDKIGPIFMIFLNLFPSFLTANILCVDALIPRVSSGISHLTVRSSPRVTWQKFQFLIDFWTENPISSALTTRWRSSVLGEHLWGQM